MSEVTLAIVAGGRGARLGGQDKGLLTLPDGTALLAHLYRKLTQRLWAECLVICRADQMNAYRPLAPDVRFVSDHYGPDLGPMAALHTALSTSATDTVQLWPVDAPVVCDRLLDELEKMTPPALVPQNEAGQAQPLFGRYHKGLLTSLENHLKTKRLAMTRWVHDEHLPTLCWPDGRCFANLNRPDDLTLLKQVQQS